MKIHGYLGLALLLLDSVVMLLSPYPPKYFWLLKVLSDLALIELYLTPLKKLLTLLHSEIQFRRAIRLRRERYTKFIEDIKTGQIQDFEQEAKKIV